MLENNQYTGISSLYSIDIVLHKLTLFYRLTYYIFLSYTVNVMFSLLWTGRALSRKPGNEGKIFLQSTI